MSAIPRPVGWGTLTILLLATCLRTCLGQVGTGTDLDAAFSRAGTNGLAAREAFDRSHRYLTAWLAHSDPVTGLIPRNLTDSRDYWNGRDSAADNYAFMVLTAAMTDRAILDGTMRRMLKTESRLTARVDRLTDDYSFSRQTWRREKFDLDATVFDSAEYAKDGLVPVTEWLGKSPWSRRLTGLVEDIWKHAAIRTPSGKLATLNFEVNGDLLQAGARCYWLTGERRFLEGPARIGDYYLLGTHHPTLHGNRLRLRDHGCEVVNGLTELYVALKKADPARAARYREPLHQIFRSILRLGRNADGLLYDWYDPQSGEHSPGLCDTWGYVFDGFYTLYLVDGVEEYRDATLKALNCLAAGYRNYPWEGPSADGYADSIEGALNLIQREPSASASSWIDSEIRVMWAKQRPDGIIEGWHGDGNFARTSLMYALWKTQGITVEPWRSDLVVGVERTGPSNSVLCISLRASAPWTGRLRFDHPRHRDQLHMPLDYPRINQFPEWFPVDSGTSYSLIRVGEDARRRVRGRDLQRGLPASVPAETTLRWVVQPQPPLR